MNKYSVAAGMMQEIGEEHQNVRLTQIAILLALASRGKEGLGMTEYGELLNKAVTETTKKVSSLLNVKPGMFEIQHDQLNQDDNRVVITDAGLDFLSGLADVFKQPIA